MDQDEIEALLKNVDARTERIEQILPTHATKDDVREEGQRTRQQFNAVAERIEESVKLIAGGHVELDKRVTRLEKKTAAR